MPGFNSDVKYKGALFHVQTQDSGPTSRCVESFIFKSGKLISSRKTDYTSYLALPRLQEKIRQILEDQHNAILKDIADGKFEHLLAPDEK